MPSLNQLFLSIVLPAIVCSVLYTILSYMRARDGEKPFLLWSTAVALGVGYIIGYLAIEGKPDFLLKESIKWAFYLTLLAIGSSSYWGASRLSSTISQLLYSVVLPRLLLDSYFRHNWHPFEGLMWWICLSVGIFLFYSIVQQSFTALPSGASCAFVYFGIAGGTALILALSGSLRLAQHAGIFVGLFGGIWILTYVLQHIMKSGSKKWTELPMNTVPVITVLFVVLWLNGYFYAEVPSLSVILLAVSPFLAQVGKIQMIQRMASRKLVFLQIGLIALCVSIAMIIAVIHSGFFGENSYG